MLIVSRTSAAYPSSPSIFAESRHGHRRVPQATNSCAAETTHAALAAVRSSVAETRWVTAGGVDGERPAADASEFQHERAVHHGREPGAHPRHPGQHPLDRGAQSCFVASRFRAVDRPAGPEDVVAQMAVRVEEEHVREDRHRVAAEIVHVDDVLGERRSLDAVAERERLLARHLVLAEYLGDRPVAALGDGPSIDASVPALRSTVYAGSTACRTEAMCATTSRTDQPAHADGAVHSSGCSDRAISSTEARSARNPSTPSRLMSPSSVAGHFGPGQVAVGAGLAREAEHPLAEDVAHDLRRAALDRVRARTQEHLAGRTRRHVEARGLGAAHLVVVVDEARRPEQVTQSS